MVKKTLTLDDTPVLEMGIIGIATPVKPHRISNELNNQLGWHLKREESLTLRNPQNSIKIPFHKFSYPDQLNRVVYYLLANHAEGMSVLPERQEADYLLLIKNGNSRTLQQDVKSKIDQLSIIQTAFPIAPEQLESKENLLIV